MKGTEKKHPLRRYGGLVLPGVYAKLARTYRESPRFRTSTEDLGAARSSAVAAHGKFDDAALGAFLTDWGIEPGDTLMVHSRFDAMASFEGTPMSLVRVLRELLGPDGTLCMPTFFAPWNSGDPPLDVRRNPSATGLVTEVFRRTSGALRSCQLRSVTAVGPQAEFLVGSHHLSPYCCGPQSPYARFAEVGAKVLCLGLPPQYNVMLHCLEDVLAPALAAKVYPSEPLQLPYRLIDGQVVVVPGYYRTRRWIYFCDAVEMLSHFSERSIQRRTFHGIQMSLHHSDHFMQEMGDMVQAGNHMYALTARSLLP